MQVLGHGPPPLCSHSGFPPRPGSGRGISQVVFGPRDGALRPAMYFVGKIAHAHSAGGPRDLEPSPLFASCPATSWLVLRSAGRLLHLYCGGSELEETSDFSGDHVFVHTCTHAVSRPQRVKWHLLLGCLAGWLGDSYKTKAIQVVQEHATVCWPYLLQSLEFLAALLPRFPE